MKQSFIGAALGLELCIGFLGTADVPGVSASFWCQLQRPHLSCTAARAVRAAPPLARACLCSSKGQCCAQRGGSPAVMTASGTMLSSWCVAS